MADPIATAADYADALLTARRSQSALFLLVLLALLTQLSIFFIARFSDVLGLRPQSVEAAAVVESTATTSATLAPLADESPAAPSHDPFIASVAAYFAGLSGFVGIILSIVLAMVLMLIVKIMLVGRLIGVSRLTSAYVWSLVLIALLFPWQALLDPAGFKFPGVLYVWQDMAADVRRFPEGFGEIAILKWTRYVGAPLLAIVVLLVIRIKAQRGLREALGETLPGEDESA
jgi:hypothetical protein